MGGDQGKGCPRLTELQVKGSGYAGGGGRWLMRTGSPLDVTAEERLSLWLLDGEWGEVIVG